jgi:chromosome segregation ATPase
MARPLSPSDSYRNGYHGNYQPRYSLDDAAPPPADPAEVERVKTENAQLRQLCTELEQALAEAAQQTPDAAAFEQRIREFETLLESKDETIRQIHAQMLEAQAALEELASKPAAAPKRTGPVPREEEMLALSEELERERRQLQEDEHSLMEQMRQMEMGMARERAEMARQRNDLQRLAGEVRHELERLGKNGALQSKMDELRAKLQDATTRRGAAPARPASGTNLPPVNPQEQQPAPQPRGSFMGRLFGGK